MKYLRFRLFVLLCVLAHSLGSFAITEDEVVWDFEWLEPNNTIEIVVGEPYQLKYACSTNRSKVFTEEYANSWVHYDFTPMQHIVNPPTGYSVDTDGIITGLIPGKYAMKYTGKIQPKDGTDKWLYIDVVSERTEKEPNNTLDSANDIYSKIRFGLYNSSDVDYFKFSHSQKPGDYVKFKIHYYGSRETPFGYRWTTYCGNQMVGSGSLLSQDQECSALVTSSAPIYLNVNFKVNYDEYFNYGEEFVAEVITDSGSTVSKQYPLSVTSIGKGTAFLFGNEIRNSTLTKDIVEGSSVTITFVPDEGFEVKSVKVNGVDVTTNVSNNQFTFSSINNNTSLEVSFEGHSPIIVFADTIVKEICVAEWDTDGDGELSKEEAAAVVYIDNKFEGQNITSFEELVYFTGLKGIYDTSFSKCSKLISIIIPKSVEIIKSSAFRWCSSLSSIIVDSRNNYFDSRGNCNAIIRKKDNVLVNGCMNTVIPSSVTEIGGEAFFGCSCLHSIKIPNSVKTIGERAFYDCSGMNSITIPKSITNIGITSFEECSGLASIVVESGNTIYDSRENCNALIHTKDNVLLLGCMNTFIPSSVTAIGNNAFAHCSGLYSISIPKSITSIGNGAFGGCSALTSLVIPNTVTSIGFSAFAGCSRLSSIVIPNSVTSIESSTFYGCTGLTSVTIPNSVTTIGNHAFYDCESLKSIILPNSITQIERYTFWGCSSLENIFIYDSVQSIDIGAFYNCVSLNSITIPNSVNSIAYDAFWGCTNLKLVESEMENPIKISDQVFKDVSSEAILRVPEGAIPNYQVSRGWTTYFKEIVEVERGNKQFAMIITSIGNGSTLYNSTIISSKSMLFTVGEGSSATISFTPDAGNRIKSVKVNGSDVTSSVSNNRYTVSNISKNTSVEIEFEAITYTLSITSIGNGTAAYDGSTIRGKTSPFTVDEGSSVVITFTPDAGNRIKSAKVNGSDVSSSVLNNCYIVSNISKDTSVEVEFVAITYTLTITSTGNGIVTYDGSSIRSKTSTFTVNEGSSALITFTPDAGYRIKSAKVNGSDVSSSVSNNRYTVNNISKNTSVEVEFEVITYTLSITSTGNGTVAYDGSSIRSKTSTFTVNEGSSALIAITPDAGYRIKSVKVNGSNVTSSVSNNRYTVSNISKDTSVEVEFVAITYTLTITSTGNGIVTYDGSSIRSKTSTFTVNEGSSALITFTPDAGYRIKSVKVNSTDVISSVLNNRYTVSNIRKNTTVEVEFEAIPPTTYSLTIKATGRGSVSFSGKTIRNNTSTFTEVGGNTAIITFTPDTGYRIKSVKVNGVLVASDVSAYQYTVSNINGDTTIEVEFMEQLMAFSSNGVNYSVASYDDRTVTVGSGSYGKALEVPANVSYQEKTWKVTGIDNGAMADNAGLAAVIWNAETRFTPNVSNPNFLLYVKSADYALSTVKNVVVSGTAERITLTDAANGNDFYCPQEFTAKHVSYTHNYKMTTGIGESRGWETIALPFDVQQVMHQSGSELVPFAKWQGADATKPFWLMELGSSGWTEATAIKANTPYIISMPNNDNYKPEFRVNGNVTFKAENVTVRRSDEMESGKGNGKTFVPNFTNQESAGYYALNVSNDYVTYSGGAAEGSRFVAGLRPVRPFEAYMTSEAGVREIAIADDLATGIAQAIVLIGGRGDTKVYDLKGRVVADGAGCSQEELRRMLPYGVYIFNGRKLIVK